MWLWVQKVLNDNSYQHQHRHESSYPLSGKLFDVNGTVYSPTYTRKGNVKYRYYISQNILQFKDHPKGLMARLPATEIEDVISRSLRAHISGALSRGADHEQQYVLQNLDKFSDEDLTKFVAKRISIGSDEINLSVHSAGLHELVQDKLSIALGNKIQLDEQLTIPYCVKQGRSGCLVINPDDKDKDLMALPADELKRLVQGIIWRDRHFAGETIVGIAESENYSRTFVRQSIYKSFETLKKYMH